MWKRSVVAVLALFVWSAMESSAQRNATTSLVLRVNPESRIDPAQVALHFRVSADGASDVVTQSSLIAARLRTLPGQTARIVARLVSFESPTGALSPGALRWAATATQGTATSGAFTSATQALVENWQNSGSLTGSINFELSDPRALPPGSYTALVKLSIETR